jgi:hypothetical protein
MPRPAGETFSLAAGLIKCSLFTIVRDESGILNCAAVAKREGRVIFLCVSKLGLHSFEAYRGSLRPCNFGCESGLRRTFRRPLLRGRGASRTPPRRRQRQDIMLRRGIICGCGG